MSNTLNLGTDGNWATKKNSLLGYNSENGNFKPLPFNFERATSATRVNKEGLIEVVGNNEPRIDFKDNSKGALLLEPTRSNVITYSNDFSNAIWTNTGAAISVNPTADLSPDGTLTGNEFNEGTSSGRRAIYEDLSVTANQINTLSVFVKKGTSNYLRLVIAENGDASDWTAVQVDLSNNSLSTDDGSSNSFTDISSSISSVDYNGYYRLQISAKHPTATSLRLLFCTSNGNAITSSNSYGRPDYTGTNKTVFVWGCQLETNSSYATSYIPTSGSVATRVSEVCDNGANEQVINSTEGVFYAEIKRIKGDTNATIISLNDGSNSNLVAFYFFQASSVAIDILSSSPAISTGVTVTDVNEFNKIALKYKSNDVALWINGVEVFTSTDTITLSGLNSVDFAYGNGAFPFYGGMKDVRVYNTALTDEELQALTSN